MFNCKMNFAALLILLIAIRRAVASCTEGQYLYSNGTCVECTRCGEHIELAKCTNTTDTSCSLCRRWQRPTADGQECEFDCSKCSVHSRRCPEEKECECMDGYGGILCEQRQSTTDAPTTVGTRNTDPEEDGNRVVLIICIIVASIIALTVTILIVLFYVTCSKRSNHDSENSDESTYSSASINSRTTLTNDHNSTPVKHNSQVSNGYRTSILPPPEPWTNNLASAIK